VIKLDSIHLAHSLVCLVQLWFHEFAPGTYGSYFYKTSMALTLGTDGQSNFDHDQNLIDRRCFIDTSQTSSRYAATIDHSHLKNSQFLFDARIFVDW